MDCHAFSRLENHWHIKTGQPFPLNSQHCKCNFHHRWNVCLYKNRRNDKRKQTKLIFKAFFSNTYIALLIPSSIGLMETPFALLIAGWGIYLLLRSKPSGFALLGFATYIRIELLILLVLVIAIILIQNPYKWIQVISSIGTGIIPLLLYDLYFFGTVIPHSIFAKSLVFTISRLDTIKYILFFSLPTSSQNYSSTLISFLLFSAILTSTTIVILQKQKQQIFIGTVCFYFGDFLP